MRETVENNLIARTFPEVVGQTRPSSPGRNKLGVAARGRDRTPDQNVRNRGRGEKGAVGMPEEVGFEVQKPQFCIICQPTLCRGIRHHRAPRRHAWFGISQVLERAEQFCERAMRRLVQILVAKQEQRVPLKQLPDLGIQMIRRHGTKIDMTHFDTEIRV
jgi:hypothetical protein